MRSKCFKAFIVALVLTGLSANVARAGWLVRSFYTGISGTATTDLTGSSATNSASNNGPKYPNYPDSTEIVSNAFYAVQTGGNDTFTVAVPGASSSYQPSAKTVSSYGSNQDNYGSMIQGYIMAPQTGNYTFWIASDDSSDLYLSTDLTPGNATKIANLSGAVGVGNWTGNASQKSAAIALTAGQQYYIKAIHKEGGGGDFVEVGWTLPDGTQQRPIPSKYLQPFVNPAQADPSFLQDLLDITVTENRPVTFQVTINASEPIMYQWYRGVDANVISPVSGATLAYYDIPVVRLTDNNAMFRVFVGAKTGNLFSRAARLIVNADTTAPTISSVSASFDQPTQVKVTFSEPISLSTISAVGNYGIKDSGGNTLAIYAVVPDTSNTNVVTLYTAQVTTTNTYTLTVNNMQDLAATPNTIAANSTKTFNYGPPIAMRFIDGVGDTTQSAITNNSKFKAGGPFNREAFQTALETADTEHGDNFIGQMRALLTPTVSGAYSFSIAADDNCLLYLSTDATPANKVLIAGHTSWTSFRQYNKFERYWASLPPFSDGSGTFGDTLLTNVTSSLQSGFNNSTRVFAFGLVASTNGNPNSAFTLTARQGSGATSANSYTNLTVKFVYDVAVGSERDDLDTTTAGAYVMTIHANANSTANNIIAAINSPLTKQRSNPVNLVAGQTYYIEADWKEGGGGDDMNVAWQIPGNRPVENNDSGIPSSVLTPLDLTLGPVTFKQANSPQNLTVVEGQRAFWTIPAFSVDGTPISTDPNGGYFYQWYRAGVPVTGAGGSGTVGTSYGATPNGSGGTTFAIGGQFNNGYLAFLVPVIYPADNGVGYSLMVSNRFSAVFSGAGVVTVTPAVPTAVAGAIFADQVSIAYSMPVDQASALTKANYILKDTTTGITTPANSMALSAVNDRSINIKTPLVKGDTYVLSISNVKDQFGTQTIVSNNYTFINLEAPYVQINNSQSATVTPAANQYEVGGGDIWGTADNFDFANVPVSGNFDFIMRVDSLANASSWSKVGIMARETLDNSAGTSRNVFALVTAGQEQAGQNVYVMQYRNATGGSTSSTGSNPAPIYPYAWVRLQRVGNVFYGWNSSDGINWNKFGTVNTDDSSSSSTGWRGATAPSPMPNTVYVGFAGTSHNTSSTAKVVVSGFSPLPPVPVDFAVTTALPTNSVVTQNRSLTLSIAGSGNNGPFSYQWLSNGVAIAGAIYSTYTTPLLNTNADGTVYSVVVKNSTSSAVEGTTKVTVTRDTTPPQLLAAAAFKTGRTLVLRFDEDLDPSSVSGASITMAGYRGSIGGHSYRSASRSVISSLSIPPGNTPFNVTVTGIKDLAGNTTPRTNALTLVNMIDQDVGSVDINTGLLTDPLEPGIGYPLGFNTALTGMDFDIQAGGSDIWNNADGFHFVYQQVSGDFDVKVRVASLQYVSDNWAKAGLMVREDTSTFTPSVPGSGPAAGGRDINIVVDPTFGANVWEMNYRAATNGASAGIPNSSAVGPVTYPNAWVRIIREGNTFYEQRSSDGAAWETRAVFAPSPPYPTNVVVGLATTAHNNTAGTHTVAQYRDFFLGTLGPGPKLTSATGGAYLNKVVANFDSPIDAITAGNAANYSLSGGLTISSVVVDPSGKSVVLTTSAQTPLTLYTLTVNNIAGLSGIPVAPNSKASFTGWSVTAGFVLHEVWNGIGKPLSNLTGNSRYPSDPDLSEYVIHFEAPATTNSNYSQKISGFVTPATSGNYTFFLSANGPAELWLSTDNTQGNAVKIAYLTNGTNVARSWAKESTGKSAAIALTGGQAYYIQALNAAGSSGNNLAVTWTSDGSTPANGTPAIGYNNLSAYFNPDLVAFEAISTQPSSVTVQAGQPASFSVGVTAFQPVFYQWQVASGGGPFTDIDGATGSSYSIAQTTPAMSGNQYQALAAIPGGSPPFLASSIAVLTVNAVPALAVKSATSVNGSTVIKLVFNEGVNATTANKSVNYAVFGGYNVLSAAVQSDAVTVLLTINTPLTASTSVWPFGVTDFAGNLYSGTPVAISIVSQAGASADNSRADTKPALSIERIGDSVVVSWSSSFGGELKLQSRTPATGWAPVTTPVVVKGSLNTVTVPVSSGATLYRLAQ